MIIGYVIYNGEEFLSKDNSTGPMSTGGYPYLEKICSPNNAIFHTEKHAQEYLNSCTESYLRLNEKPTFIIRPVTLQ